MRLGGALLARALVKVWLFALTCVLLTTFGGRALGATQTLARPVTVLVPLDDRPVTYQLPRMLGAIAGVDVRTPPRASLGRYLTPGDPDAILTWLASDDTRPAFAFVLSNDMLAYGGLVASRTPQTPPWQAISRQRQIASLRAARPSASFYGFGTVMRLAPTGVPALGEAKNFFAAGRDVDLLQEYANLPDPPTTEASRAREARLRTVLGPVLGQYLFARGRDLATDKYLLQLAAEGVYDRVVLGQDDAGPTGLHLRDLATLRAAVAQFQLAGRAAIEPGADELGMVMLAHALARHAGMVPGVRIVYSRPDGAAVQDPLEFVPIDTTIADIVSASGARRVDAGGDVTLYVKVTGTDATQETAFVRAIGSEVEAGRTVAVADLTFLGESYDEQRSLTEELIAANLAGRIAAFASWNTTANTVGTAMPEAIAVLTGKRAGTFVPAAHARFMLDRYADDYAFHIFVRPELNKALTATGVADHTYLLPDVAKRTASDNRFALWQHALHLLQSIYPGYANRGITIALPWDRTFETELDVRIAPR